jgi:hypothetical protein
VTAANQIDLLAKIGIALLLFVVFGVGLGHIDSETVSVVTLVAIITIAVSTYLIT